MSALDWIISIGITILAYFVPYIIFLACHKEPISQEKAKKFTIIWAIISFLLVFAFKLLIIYFGGNTSSGMNIFAVFVWNGLGYFILINSNKRIGNDESKQSSTELELSGKNDLNIHSTFNNIQNGNNAQRTEEYFKEAIDKRPLNNNEVKCPYCGNIQNNKLKRCLHCSRIIEVPIESSPVKQHSQITYKEKYNMYKKNADNLTCAEQYDLAEDFAKRAGEQYITAESDCYYNIAFGSKSKIFNGYLLRSVTGRVKDFKVLIFENAEFDITMQAGDILYYINCIVNKITSPKNDIADDIDRLTRLRKSNQLTEDEYLKLVNDACSNK